MTGSAALTIPGGRDKGVPISEAPMETVNYWAKRIADDMAAGNSRNIPLDKSRLAALRARQAVGGNGGKRTAPQTRPQIASAPAANDSAALALRDPSKAAAITGSFNTPSAVMKMLQEAARECHLITPQTSCGELPVGCAVASSLVWVDPDNETYGIPHKDADRRGLDRNALNKIAAAAGLSWDPILSCRLDDQSNPHYVHWRAVCTARNFDGTQRTLVGNVEIDLRDGSEAAIASSEKELPIARKFILRHAESKAKNRCIRDLGVRTSYMRGELAKPFLVAKITFTGQTEDPALKRLFAEKTFESFHGSRAQLYPNAARPGHAPPPLGAASLDETNDDQYGDDDDYSYDTEGNEATPSGEDSPAITSGDEHASEQLDKGQAQPAQGELLKT